MAEFTLPHAHQTQNLINANGSLSGYDMSLSAPVSPVFTKQTITTTKAALPSSPLSDRTLMAVKNTDPIRTIRLGPSATVAEKTGYLLEPLQMVKILFDPNNAVAIWAVAVGAEVQVEVIES